MVRREHGGPTDDDLIAAVSGRNHEALGAIYRRHGGAVWSVAKRVCGAEHAELSICASSLSSVVL